MATFTSLQNYWRCPRRWALSEQWEPKVIPEPLSVGKLFHMGVAEYYRNRLEADSGLIPASSHSLSINAALGCLSATSPGVQMQTALGELAAQLAWEANVKRATNMLEMWLHERGAQYEPVLVEHEIKDDEGTVWGHVDLVARHHAPGVDWAPLCVVEFKTGARSDLSSYHFMGQADTYAYLLEVHEGLRIDICAYELVNDDGIFSEVFMPDTERGCWFAEQLGWLTMLERGLAWREAQLEQPRFLYDCPRCMFYKPCQLMEARGDWRKHLADNYVQRDSRLLVGEGSGE